MFHFIGGVPRAGKSILSTRLSQKLGIAKIDFDDITFVLQEILPEYGLFMEMDSEANRQAKSLPIIKTLIKYYQNQNRSLIIEGDNFSPNDFRLYQKLTNNQIRMSFLGYPDIEPKIKIQLNTQNTKVETVCWFENLDDDKEKIRIIKEFIDRSKEFKSQIKKISDDNLRFFDTIPGFEAALNEAQRFHLLSL